MMRDYCVTFEAIWYDRFGVKWTTGKQRRSVKADSRVMACQTVRGSWPEGAEGECKAEPENHSLLEMVKANLGKNIPPSTWNPDPDYDLLEMEPMYYPI